MRLSKTVNNIQYTYQYNGGKLMHETRGSRILDYFYDSNGQAIAVRYKNNNNTAGTYYYYAYNSRGDITGLYDESGSLECTYTYDAWGNILSVKNPVGMEMTSDAYIGNLQSLKYRGYYYDYETGLYYLQSRYYDPVTHRFINEDMLVSTGTGVLGYNMFAYCENNPVLYSDPSGNHASNFTCGDPTCIQCNPFRREFLQSQKGIRQYNKCNGTYYIGMDDNGNFISNDQIIASQYWASLSTEVNNMAVPSSTLLGSAGYSALGTSYLGCASTPFSCLSHLDNPYLTGFQKGTLVTLEIGSAAAGVTFAVIIANLWNPVGWAALAVTAAGIGLAALTSYSLTQQEIAWENANKEKWGCYYW